MKFIVVAALIAGGWWYASKSLDLDKALASAHEHRDAWWSEGMVFTIANAYYGRDDYARARKAYTQVIEDYPKGPHTSRALLRLSECDREVRDYAAAREVLEQFLRDFPDDPDRAMAQRRHDVLPAQ